MSKKIIAIALFATMVFSLFAVNAGAIWTDDAELPGDIGIYVVNKTAGKAADGGYRADYLNDDLTVPDPAEEQVDNASKKTSTLKGAYKNFVETDTKYVDETIVKYYVYFILEGYSPTDEDERGIKFDFTGFTGESGSVEPEAFDEDDFAKIPSGKVWYGFRYEFTLEKGGNSKTITLRYEDAKDRDYEFIHTIKYNDTTSAGKNVKDLVVYPSSNPAMDGDYNAYIVNNVLFIDVARDIGLATNNYALPYSYDNGDADDLSPLGTAIAPMTFKFETVDGDTIPAKNKSAYVVESYDGTSSSSGEKKFFNFEAWETMTGKDIEAQRISNSDGIDLPINLAFASNVSFPKSMRILIEDSQYVYDSGNIDIQYRVIPRNEITNVVIEQGRNITLEVGESVDITISSAFRTTYTEIALGDNGQQDVVLIRDNKLTGLKVGTTMVYVYAGSNKAQVIDTITVNVVAKSTTTTPPASTNENYRVVVKGSLNIRSGPGTSYSTVGKYVQNDIVEVVSITNGWALLSNGTYVSAAYLVKVSSTTGNAITTASSLNVRSGPGTSYAPVTKYPYGTSVNVVGYSADGKWAQLDNGYWVSAQYIK